MNESDLMPFPTDPFCERDPVALLRQIRRDRQAFLDFFRSSQSGTEFLDEHCAYLARVLQALDQGIVAMVTNGLLWDALEKFEDLRTAYLDASPELPAEMSQAMSTAFAALDAIPPLSPWGSQ